MLEPPASGQRASFTEGFGPRVLLTVDTEEEFDWAGDFDAHAYGLDHVHRIAKFQEFCENLGVVPVYLIDWPIANSKIAVEILGPAVAAKRAEIGIQLHPWVNPPHAETVDAYSSYAGNLPPGLMREKFMLLRNAIVENFDTMPLMYRAGRYGLGEFSADVLKEGGIAIDSSVRSLFDYSSHHGPDYSRHPLHPYWIDEDRRLLELPLTTVFRGALKRQGRGLFPLADKIPRLPGLLARAGLLERIALTPEGISVEDALRGIEAALDDGLPIIVLSFHSPSLVPGNTPYVHDDADLDALYDWWRAIYAYLDRRGVQPTTVREIMQYVEVEPHPLA